MRIEEEARGHGNKATGIGDRLLGTSTEDPQSLKKNV